MNDKQGSAPSPLAQVRDEFVTQWGAIGSAWGINRTMAQIHALLITTTNLLSTDDIMAELKISRGNAHANLRDLVTWGLVRSVVRKDERKEYFEAEKDAGKMFCIIVRERSRRELRPAMDVLHQCAERTTDLKGHEALAFNNQMRALEEFLNMADKVIAKATQSQPGRVFPWALKLLK